MTDEKQVYTIVTPFGPLNAEWQDAHTLRVWTTMDTYHHDPVTLKRINDLGTPLVVNGVRYGVQAYLHRDGCLTADKLPQYHQGNPCRAHGNGETGWVWGSVNNGRHDSGKVGHIDSHTLYPGIGKGGSYYDGGASSSAHAKITAAILAGVANLARTARSGPEEARIANLQRDFIKATANMRRLETELGEASADVARRHSELFDLNALPEQEALAA